MLTLLTLLPIVGQVSETIPCSSVADSFREVCCGAVDTASVPVSGLLDTRVCEAPRLFTSASSTAVSILGTEEMTKFARMSRASQGVDLTNAMLAQFKAMNLPPTLDLEVEEYASCNHAIHDIVCTSYAFRESISDCLDVNELPPQITSTIGQAPASTRFENQCEFDDYLRSYKDPLSLARALTPMTNSYTQRWRSTPTVTHHPEFFTNTFVAEDYRAREYINELMQADPSCFEVGSGMLSWFTYAYRDAAGQTHSIWQVQKVLANSNAAATLMAGDWFVRYSEEGSQATFDRVSVSIAGGQIINVTSRDTIVVDLQCIHGDDIVEYETATINGTKFGYISYALSTPSRRHVADKMFTAYEHFISEDVDEIIVDLRFEVTGGNPDTAMLRTSFHASPELAGQVPPGFNAVAFWQHANDKIQELFRSQFPLTQMTVAGLTDFLRVQPAERSEIAVPNPLDRPFPINVTTRPMPYVSKPVKVLVNRFTTSAPEYSALAFRWMQVPSVTIIGEESSGALHVMSTNRRALEAQLKKACGTDYQLYIETVAQVPTLTPDGSLSVVPDVKIESTFGGLIGWEHRHTDPVLIAATS